MKRSPPDYRTVRKVEVPQPSAPSTRPPLPTGRRLVHHLRLLFLKSLSDPLTTCHELLYASSHAAGLALDKGFCCEVIDAGVEAVGYEVGEHL